MKLIMLGWLATKIRLSIKGQSPISFLLIFVLFRQYYRIKAVGFNGIWARIIKVEGQHADHLTTITVKVHLSFILLPPVQNICQCNNLMKKWAIPSFFYVWNQQSKDLVTRWFVVFVLLDTLLIYSVTSKVCISQECL